MPALVELLEDAIAQYAQEQLALFGDKPQQAEPIKMKSGQLMAPKGGATSDVDGKFYAGGEFMPVHGLSEKVEKKPKGDGPPQTPSKPNENARKREAPEPRKMTPEDIEAERERREYRKQWDEVRSGPIGQVLWLGEHPHHIKRTQPGITNWEKWADTVPNERLEQVRDAAKKIAGKAIGEKEGPDQIQAYLDYQDEFQATAGEQYMHKKHVKAKPASAAALHWVGEAIDYGRMPAMLELTKVMRGEQSEGPQEKAQYAQVDNGLRRMIAQAEADTATDPTEIQKKLGNYRKGKFRWNGLQIVIETRAGAIRRGMRKDGTSWSHRLPWSYGYISAHNGIQMSDADGDHLDCFVGPDPESQLVFIVDQQKPDGNHDEHKLMLGFVNEREARQAYLDSYSSGWRGLKSITAMTLPEFREWLEEGDTRRPVAQYAEEHEIAQYARIKPAAGQKAMSWHEFKESEHPRGQPDNKGEFVAKGQGGVSSDPDKEPAKKSEESPEEAYKRLGTKAKAFKAWFGDWEHDPDNASQVVNSKGEPQETSPISGEGSKVVREGKPVAVYHGTTAGGFDKFEKKYLKPADQLLYGQGFYFTEDASVADEYAGRVTFNITDRLGSKEEAEAQLKAKEPEWTERYGRNKTDFELKVVADGPGWRVAGTGFDKREVRKLSRELTESDMSKLIDHLQQKYEAASEANKDKSGHHDEETRLHIAQQQARHVRKLMHEHPESWQQTEQGARMIDEIAGPTWHKDAAETRKLLGVDVREEEVPSERKEVYLNIRKPFSMDDRIGSRLWDHASNHYGLFGGGTGPNMSGESFYQAISQKLGGKKYANDYLKQMGHDGITHTGGQIMGSKEHKVWIAFESNQIKAVDNRGTFDPQDERMKYALAEVFDDLISQYALKPAKGQASMFGFEDKPKPKSSHSSAFDESKHPRGQPQNAGEFVQASKQVHKTEPAKTPAKTPGKTARIDRPFEAGDLPSQVRDRLAELLSKEDLEKARITADMKPVDMLDRAQNFANAKGLAIEDSVFRKLEERITETRDQVKAVEPEVSPKPAEKPQEKPAPVVEKKPEPKPEPVPRDEPEASQADAGEAPITDAQPPDEPVGEPIKVPPQALGQLFDNAIKEKTRDFGAKIENARKFNSVPLGKRAKKEETEKDDRPAWERRYRIAEDAKKPGEFFIVDERKEGGWRGNGNVILDPTTRGNFKSREEAERAIPLHELARTHSVGSLGKGDDRDYVIYRKVADRKHPVVKRGFASYDEATKYMVTHANEIIEHKFPSFETYRYLTNVERNGPENHKGDVSPTDFQQAFNFRGGVFGKWQEGKDGQTALNHAYDAFHDLSDALGLPPRGTSLNGGLAMGFGALGTGGKDAALAHFEPGYKNAKGEAAGNVINLTKMKGAGSLAHEWGHAFDDYLAKEAGDATPGSQVSTGLRYNHKLRPEVAEALKGIKDAINTRETTTTKDESQSAKHVDMQREHLATTLKGLERAFEPSTYRKVKPFTAAQQKEWDETKEKILSGDHGGKAFVPGKSRMGGHESFKNLQKLNELYKVRTGRSFHTSDRESTGNQIYWQIKRVAEAEKGLQDAKAGTEHTGRVRSNFMNESLTLDQTRVGDYYSKPEEMFARAFEGYVQDKLDAKGRKSQYLVARTHNKHYEAFGMRPYPEGEERQSIGKAFDKLFEVLKHEPREDEKGEHVRLYSMAEMLDDAIAQYAGLFDAEMHPRGQPENAGEFRKKEQPAVSGPRKPTKKPDEGQGKLFAMAGDQGSLFGGKPKTVATVDTAQPEKRAAEPDKVTESPLDKDVVKQAAPLPGQKTLVETSDKHFKVNDRAGKGEAAKVHIDDLEFTEPLSEEVSRLDDNSDMPIIVEETDTGYKLIDGFGRASGMKNDGRETIHAIIVTKGDIAERRGAGDDAEWVAKMHSRYAPKSKMAKEDMAEYAITDQFDAAFAHYAATKTPAPHFHRGGNRFGNIGSTGTPDTDKKIAAVNQLANSPQISALGKMFSSAIGALTGRPAQQTKPGGSTAAPGSKQKGTPAPAGAANQTPAQQAIQQAKVAQAQANAQAAHHRATAAGHNANAAQARAQTAQQKAAQAGQPKTAAPNPNVVQGPNGPIIPAAGVRSPAPAAKKGPHAPIIGGKSGERPTTGSGRDRWVTIQGTHVLIDDKGKIEKGPAAIAGKNVGNLPPRQEAAKPERNEQNPTNPKAKPRKPLPGWEDFKKREDIQEKALDTPELSPEQQAIQSQILGGMDTSLASAPPIDAQPAAEQPQEAAGKNADWRTGLHPMHHKHLESMAKNNGMSPEDITPEQMQQIKQFVRQQTPNTKGFKHEAWRQSGSLSEAFHKFVPKTAEAETAEQSNDQPQAVAAKEPAAMPNDRTPVAEQSNSTALATKNGIDRAAYLKGIEAQLLRRRELREDQKTELANVRAELARLGHAPTEKTQATAQPAAVSPTAEAPKAAEASPQSPTGERPRAAIAKAKAEAAEHKQHAATLQAALDKLVASRHEAVAKNAEGKATAAHDEKYAKFIEDKDRQIAQHIEEKRKLAEENEKLKGDNPGERRRTEGTLKAQDTNRSNKEELTLRRAAHTHGVDFDKLNEAVDREISQDQEHWDALKKAVGTYGHLSPSERKKLQNGDTESLRKKGFDELEGAVNGDTEGELAHLGVKFDDVMRAIADGMPDKPSAADPDYVEKVASRLKHEQPEPEEARGEADDSESEIPAHNPDDDVPFSLRARGGLIAQYAQQFQNAMERHVCISS